MTLDGYLKQRNIKEAEFAALIGADQSTVNRLRKGSIPSPRLMSAIVKHTGGAVTANDFFGIAA